MKKKLFYFLLVDLLMVVPSFAQLSVWSGSNSPYTQGSGTSADPYVIETADQLAYLAQLGATNKYFVLNTDIDIDGLKWRSIQSFTNSSFDGNGHSIINLTAPLFYYVNNSSISNIKIEATINDTITFNEQSDSKDGLYGTVAKVIENGSHLTYCFAKGDVYVYARGKFLNYGNGKGGVVYIGGICGESHNSTINRCVNSANIQLTTEGQIAPNGTSLFYYVNEYAAGVCGISVGSNSILSSCVNKGNISISTCYYKGGVYHDSGTLWRNCSAISSLIDNLSYCYNVSPSVRVFCESATNVYNCYTITGTISAYNRPYNCWHLSSTPEEYAVTDAELRGAAFPTILNDENDLPFICDVTPNVNNGYPILSFQIVEEVTNDTITRGESDAWGDSIYTESGEYYYYTANDWGATKNTLKLVVEEIPVSLTLSVNNAVMGTVSGGGTYLSNDTVSISANANYGYHFVDWSDGNATNPRQIILGAADSSLVANFAINQYAASLATNDPALGSVTGSGTYDYLSMITATANPQSHCHFVKWSDEVTSNPRYIELTQDTSLTAIFAKDQHVLTVLSNNETAGSVAGGGTFDYYSIVNISATANVGYKFVQWSDGVTTNPRQLLVESDLTLTAQFEQCKYQLILQTSDVNAGNVYGGGEFTYGVSTNIAAVANEGCIFVDWSDGDTNASRTIIMTDNLTLTANFSAIKYTITAEPNDPSMGMVIGAGEYGYKANVQLMAVANAGYEFVQWSNGETNNPYSFVANADLSIVAEFKESSSALEDLTASNNASKVVVDGHVYIIRGNSIYNIVGFKVK